MKVLRLYTSVFKPKGTKCPYRNYVLYSTFLKKGVSILNGQNVQLELIHKRDLLLKVQNEPIKNTSYVAIIKDENGNELVSDGYKSMRGKEVITIMENSTLDFKGLSITKAQGGYLVNGEYKLAYAGVGLFPRRAILRVGMLLRDSEGKKIPLPAEIINQ